MQEFTIKSLVSNNSEQMVIVTHNSTGIMVCCSRFKTLDENIESAKDTINKILSKLEVANA